MVWFLFADDCFDLWLNTPGWGNVVAWTMQQGEEQEMDLRANRRVAVTVSLCDSVSLSPFYCV